MCVCVCVCVRVCVCALTLCVLAECDLALKLFSASSVWSECVCAEDYHSDTGHHVEMSSRPRPIFVLEKRRVRRRSEVVEVIPIMQQLPESRTVSDITPLFSTCCSKTSTSRQTGVLIQAVQPKLREGRCVFLSLRVVQHSLWTFHFTHRTLNLSRVKQDGTKAAVCAKCQRFLSQRRVGLDSKHVAW